MSTNRFKEYIFLLSYRPSLNYKERLYMSTLSMLVKNIQDPEPHKVTILDFSLDGMVPPKPPGVIPTEGVYSARRKAKGDRSQVLSFEYQELPNARKDPQFTTGIESLFLYLEKMDSQYQAACIFYIGHGDYNSLGFSRFVTSRSVNVYSWSGDWKKVRENIHPHCFVKLLSCAKVNVFSFQSDYCNYRSDEAQRDPNNSGFSIDEINEVLSPFDHSLLDNFTEAEIIQWFRGTIRRRSLARTLYNPLGDGRKLVELNCFEIEDLNVRDELYSPVLYRLFKTFYAKGGSKSFRRGANATYFAPAKKLAEQMHKVMFKPIGGNYAYSSSIAVVLSHYLGVPVHAAAIGIGQSFFDVKNWYVNRRGFDDLENWEGGIFVTNPKSLDKKKIHRFLNTYKQLEVKKFYDYFFVKSGLMKSEQQSVKDFNAVNNGHFCIRNYHKFIGRGQLYAYDAKLLSSGIVNPLAANIPGSPLPLDLQSGLAVAAGSNPTHFSSENA